jgi:hypothetical protein
MIRTIVLSAVAAIAITAPAQAQSVRISLVGKTEAQIQADVQRAARAVCFKATRSETLALEAFGRCVKATTATTNTKLAEAKGSSTALAAAN